MKYLHASIGMRSTCAREQSILEDRLRNEEAHRREVENVNRKLFRQYRELLKFVNDLANNGEIDSLQTLEMENKQLRIENQHLRDLLELANHDFSAELASDIPKGSSSEVCSFLLTTPPRSPTHGNKYPTNRRNPPRSTTASPNRVTTNQARLQPPAIITEDFIPDIADVGPPMSPPPHVQQKKISAPHITASDPNEAIDAQEAQEGAEEVEHDLSN